MDYLSILRVLDTDYKIKDEEAARTNHTHRVEEIEGAAKEGHQHQASEIAGLSTVATSGSYSDLQGKPSAATASADGLMTSADKKKLDNKVDNTAQGVSAALNKLATGASTPVDADYYISQDVNGGTSESPYRRRPVRALWYYIKGKADAVYAAVSHTHPASQVSGLVMSCKVDSHAVSARPVHRFATWKCTYQYGDCSSILLFHGTYDGGRFAVVKLSARTNNSGTTPTISARVLACSPGFDPGCIKVARSGMSGDAQFDAFAVMENDYWIRTRVVNLTYWDSNDQFRMVNSEEYADAAKCYECWASMDDAATALVGKPYDAVKDSTIDGMARYAASLRTPRTIALSGAVTGSAKFDGSGDVTISTTANESYISSPISGLYNMAVDADGNLWVYHSDSDKAPNFEYDPATGNLYYVTEA
nr:MAG TPA: Dec protein, OB-Fold, Decoration, VIRAL PROTEIN [Caudoviricetes sp.]